MNPLPPSAMPHPHPGSATPSTPHRRATVWRCLALLAASLGSAQAALPQANISDVVKDHQDSVLFLGGSFKYLCGRCTQEHQFALMSSAVVVDPKGVFLSAAAGPLMDPKAEIRSSALHIRMPDGTEVPVGIAIKDEELAVMALTLEKPEAAPTQSFKALSLDGAPRARFLDELIVVRRHDAMTGFMTSGSSIRVDALQAKPKTTYLSAGLSTSQGVAPCFDAKGRLVALSIGAMLAVAPDELADLVVQAKKKQTK